MVRDLSCAYTPFTRAFDKTQFNRYCFEGVNDEDGPVPTDHVHFTSAASLGLAQSYGLAEVAYYLKPMEEKGCEGLYYLMRREDARPHDGLSEGGAVMELAENVVSLSLVYLETPEREVPSWSLKERLKLPPQVKIVLTVRQGNEELPFTAIANLPLAIGKLGSVTTTQGSDAGGDQSATKDKTSEQDQQTTDDTQSGQTAELGGAKGPAVAAIDARSKGGLVAASLFGGLP
ncbi:MAG: hypothetical protein BWY87_00968 [Deltaproteobacteria bacterium ADurb.Bin510]|nr:MAG: hypothetical protein BWY87_00968 [Deltaproteobacteria bacterium ADurb.Bin510]